MSNYNDIFRVSWTPNNTSSAPSKSSFYNIGSPPSPSQSTPAFIGNLSAPTASSASNTSGGTGIISTTQNTISNSWNTALTKLSQALTSLSGILGQIKSGGSAFGGSVSGGTSSSGGSSYFQSVAPYSSGGSTSTITPTITNSSYSQSVAPYSSGGTTISNTPVSYFQSTPPYGQGSISVPTIGSKPVSGLANEIEEDEKNKYNWKQQAQLMSLKENSGVNTRNSWLRKLTASIGNLWNVSPSNFFSTPPTGTTTTTTTTLPITTNPNNNIFNNNAGNLAMSNGALLPTAGIGGNTTGIEVSPITRETTSAISTIKNTFDNEQNEMNNIIAQTAELLKNFETIEKIASETKSETENLNETDIEKPVEKNDEYNQYLTALKSRAEEIYNKYNTLSSRLDEIDKIVVNAMAGFRKMAEQIRNNPDLTLWQRARALKELDDLQNYAPVFDGLSLRDLIAYRGQLASNINTYADFYNSLLSQYNNGLTLARKLENDELDAQIQRLNISTKQAQLQQTLAGKTETKERVDEQGRLHLISYTITPDNRVINIQDQIIGSGYGKAQGVYRQPTQQDIQGFANWFNNFIEAGRMTLQDYNTLKNSWINNGFNPVEFDRIFKDTFNKLANNKLAKSTNQGEDLTWKVE